MANQGNPNPPEPAEQSELVNRYRYEIGELVDIAKAITQERNIDKLLDIILEKSRFITGADAGSIYVLEGESKEVAERHLHFKLSQNDSVEFEPREFEVPVSRHSIVGNTVLTRKPINIADVYQRDCGVSYEYDSSFDRRFGYRTRSVLAVPLISAQDEVIGVIQLINKKRQPAYKLRDPEDFQREVLPFDQRSEEMAAALAALAGIALENALLYDEIQQIFEGFVRASVQAIEQRDPTTSGHSLRVSALSCELARQVDRVKEGPYGDAGFTQRDMRELRYASLLHDFGKIGVREEVLVKAKKLYPTQHQAIRQRLDYAIKSAESEVLRKKLELVLKGASPEELMMLDTPLSQRQAELQEAWDFISRANEPAPLQEGDLARLAEVAAMEYSDLDGKSRRLLEDDEVVALSISRGSLSPAELQEIRSHVVHTYNFLAKIPWGKSLAHIPEIAGAHHERLDGSGYPAGIKADRIPLQSRIIAVADVFDALTASDRPYKKAIALDRALGILESEAKHGFLDAELVRIFREAKVYKAAK